MGISRWKIWNKAERIPEIYGTLIALGLILYFFVMYAAGLIHVIELRLLNLLFIVAGVYFALKQHRRTHQSLHYFRALTVGTATAVVGVSTFALFLFIFLMTEGNLMRSIEENEPIGQYLNPYMASFVVFLEGVFSGFGISYMLAHFISTDKANEPTERESSSFG